MEEEGVGEDKNNLRPKRANTPAVHRLMRGMRLQFLPCRDNLVLSIRQHTPAYAGIRQHSSAFVSIRQHTSAHVSIRATTWSSIIEVGVCVCAYVAVCVCMYCMFVCVCV